MIEKPSSIDPLDWEEVEFARTMPAGEKLWLGLDLFDRACKYMLMGIEHQFPGVDHDRALEILCERLDALERVESRQ